MFWCREPSIHDHRLSHVSRPALVDVVGHRAWPSERSVFVGAARARGFVFPGVEDFGITPLESLASGTPIIAFKAGGVLETLNNDVAQFFEEAKPGALIQAVEAFEAREFERKVLFDRAESFSKTAFKNKISQAIEELLN